MKVYLRCSNNPLDIFFGMRWKASTEATYDGQPLLGKYAFTRKRAISKLVKSEAPKKQNHRFEEIDV